MSGGGGSSWSILVRLVLSPCSRVHPSASLLLLLLFFLFCFRLSLFLPLQPCREWIHWTTLNIHGAEGTRVHGCIFICAADAVVHINAVHVCLCPYPSSSSVMPFCLVRCLFLISASIAWMSSFITFRLLSGPPSFRERVLFTSAAFSWRSEDTKAEDCGQEPDSWRAGARDGLISSHTLSNACVV